MKLRTHYILARELALTDEEDFQKEWEEDIENEKLLVT
jgi:hypothetical protein